MAITLYYPEDSLWIRIQERIPFVTNVVLIADNVWIIKSSVRNFYSAPSVRAKVWFGAGLIFGTIGTISCGIKLGGICFGIPWSGFLASFCGRNCNRVGKYTLTMGSLATGNISNPTVVATLATENWLLVGAPSSLIG